MRSQLPISRGLEAALNDFFSIEAQYGGPRPHRLGLHPAQRQVRAEARRFNVIDCGRRWGKTLLDCDLLAETAAAGYPAGYFAPTYKYLLAGWRDIKASVAALTRSANDSEHRIELTTGGSIEAWSLDNEGGGSSTRKYKAGRSRKYKRVCIDEAALIPNLQAVFDYAIAPTLIDLKGDAWFTSTPSGKGAFYRMWLKGQKEGLAVDPNSDWMSWQMPTAANPYIPPDEIERARRDYPDAVFRQEYLAEFLEDGGAVFRNIAACTRAKAEVWRDCLDPYHVYVISWDLAKKEDFSVMTVIDCTTKTVVNIDRFNHVEYMLQVPRLVALAEAFQPTEIVVEENANEALIELLQQTSYTKLGKRPAHAVLVGQEVVTREEAEAAAAAIARMELALGPKSTYRSLLPITPFMATNASKEEAVQALVLAFERREITIPDDAALLTELEVFGMERLPSGRFRYAAPEGEHDDTVISLAEGWYRARRYMSEEALTPRVRAIRQLQPSLQPQNIASNPHPMAANSQQYWLNTYEAQIKRSHRTHFMQKLHGDA